LEQIIKAVNVLPFDEASVDKAVEINASLKQKRKQIDLADLFIAATAVSNNLLFATLNKKHFDRVKALKIFQ